jgi:ribosomal protein L7/L12
MKLGLVNFSRLVSWISARSGAVLDAEEITQLNEIVDFEECVRQPVNVTEVNVMLACMQKGEHKIEAIRAYRALTSMGLKESKDAVEQYWYSPPPSASDYQAKLLKKISQQLNENYEGREHSTSYTLKNFNNDQLHTIKEFIESFSPVI